MTHTFLNKQIFNVSTLIIHKNYQMGESLSEFHLLGTPRDIDLL